MIMVNSLYKHKYKNQVKKQKKQNENIIAIF